jgi:hypothetical protein
MVKVSRNSEKLVAYLLWRGAKWYVRQRLPSARTLAISGLIVCAGAAAAAVASGRRAGG